MLKKIMLTMVMCLMFAPATVSFAASGDGFISETDSKLLMHDFRWVVTVYRLEDGKEVKILDETLDKAVLQKDGSYISSSDKFTILEPKASDKSKDVIILKMNNIDVGNKKYSETFTYEKSDKMFYLQKNSDKTLLVELTIRLTGDGLGCQDKPNHVFS